MLVRLILLLCLGVAAWAVLKRFWPEEKPPAKYPSDGHYQRMLSCERCGVHLPADQALSRRGRHYCGRAHLPAE